MKVSLNSDCILGCLDGKELHPKLWLDSSETARGSTSEDADSPVQSALSMLWSSY